MTRRRRVASHTLIIDYWLDDATASAELDGAAGVVVPRALLPADAGPDVVLRVECGTSRVTIVVDADATAAAQRESEELADRLKQRDAGGDVAL